MAGACPHFFTTSQGRATRRRPPLERVWTRAAELGYGRIFRATVGTAMNDDHIPLQQAGIRTIDVIDFDYGPGNSYWHTLEDTADKVSAQSLAAVGNVAVALTR